MRNTFLAFLIASILAIIASMYISPKSFDLYFDLEVAASHPTTIETYYDTGSGFIRQQSSRKKIPGRSEPYFLRFKLPNKIVDYIRLDFDERVEELFVTKASLWCLRTDIRTSISLENIIVGRNVTVIDANENFIKVQAAGPDPQMLLPLQDLYVRNFNIRLAVLLLFLIYPFSSTMLWFICICCNRFIPDKKLSRSCADSHETAAAHYLVLSVTVTVVVLASIHFLEKYSRESNYLIEGLAHTIKPYSDVFSFKEDEIIRPDGLRISTRLYYPDAVADGHPAFLLLHGNYPAGQSHPLYQVLANELAKSGFVVLTIDLAGYGKSGDPYAGGPDTDLSFESETTAALEYLRTQPSVDPDRIGVIGHSMGADPALRVGLADSSVATITLIGPPRRVQERFYSPEDAGFFWHWANKVRKERYGEDGFPNWYTKRRWKDDIISRDMLYMLPALSQPTHKPVLFLDGERESHADRKFLADYVYRCSFPKKYITIGKTDHDCNVGLIANQVYFDPAVMKELVEIIGQWHLEERNQVEKAWNYLINLLDLLFAAPSIRMC